MSISLPNQVLGVHHHGDAHVHEDEAEAEEEQSLFPPHLQKICALLASVYAFFMLELCLSTKHKHSHGDTTDDEIGVMF